MEKITINLWANFLANEKLTPNRVPDPMILVKLAEELAKIRKPSIRMHKDKLASRQLVCETAISLGIDLPSIKCKGKPAIGRGLLDAWNKVYQSRFGSTTGTPGNQEAKRRDIVTKLLREDDTHEHGS